jgi:transposase
MKRLKEDRVSTLFAGDEDLVLVESISKEAIDFLTRQIRKIEKVIEEKVELREAYRYLLTLPGVGKILALTIMLETGLICRFAKVGNYVSYCRKVSSQWLSNEKVKGKGNKKSGNKYLAWTFSEAAEFARRQLVHLSESTFITPKWTPSGRTIGLSSSKVLAMAQLPLFGRMWFVNINPIPT